MTMSGYTKLFSSILASTVWRESLETRVVWITLLAMADKNGVAEGSIPGLADFARVPVEATRRALKQLMAPDPDSRSKEYEGRRLEAIPEGWRLLNHAKYRAKMGADERREYNRLKQQQYRGRLKSASAVKSGQRMSLTVNHSTHCVDNTKAEAEAKADTKKDRTPLTPLRGGRAFPLEAEFKQFTSVYPVSRRVGGKTGRSAFAAAMQGKDGADLDAMLAALEQQKRSEQWQTPKLIPLMTTWLNQERWVQVLPEAATRQEPMAWFAECQREHNGQCASRHAHFLKMRGIG